jgi:hypothetical protein
MRRFIAAVSIALLAAGCVAAPNITSSFNPSEAEFINKSGLGVITGQAFLRRNDGIVVYAAGSDVVLVPKTAYAAERMNALYRGGKFNNIVPEPTTTDPLYRSMSRTVRANGEGRFRFEGLADGDYYVLTRVVWLIGSAQQGGNLMETASIRNGQSVDLIMTGQ